ncbi:hypothetical protein A6A08_00815 [Nocardiopsis sp. TSRI0078]|uniref:hypothetical protein n=1 Tax=unclassified Nocardiopsis TaxID=2649073 RepID=UPI00093908FF|nr:hypothetical protein [Nocardiopsis sp. TSRI0078]OKI23378.1 hypothetical protein A6A08_00815 [Nocardiopsis sp. TSRI0078]
MKRFASVSGLVLATGLAFAAMTGTAAADNNSEIQNVTVPICAEVIAFTGLDGGDCNVVSKDVTSGIVAMD